MNEAGRQAGDVRLFVFWPTAGGSVPQSAAERGLMGSNFSSKVGILREAMRGSHAACSSGCNRVLNSTAVSLICPAIAMLERRDGASIDAGEVVRGGLFARRNHLLSHFSDLLMCDANCPAAYICGRGRSGGDLSRINVGSTVVVRARKVNFLLVCERSSGDAVASKR